MSNALKWTDAELERLLTVAHLPNREIAQMFPHRTYESIKHKSRQVIKCPNRKQAALNKAHQRVRSYILQKGGTECWPWQGGTRKGGYGRIKIFGKSQVATRVVWEMEHGPIPSGMEVCHHCDNPNCCNPNHLFLGTTADNKMDSVRKSRHAFGERNGGGVKLNEKAVQEILQSNLPHNILAANYGVTPRIVRLIRLKILWKHVSVA